MVTDASGATAIEYAVIAGFASTMIVSGVTGIAPS
jgi:Flp pilus assembly pilin Flp